MGWWDATSDCPSDFRLPTMRELVSIVDLTVSSGARIDQKMFPGMPSGEFWTSSRSAEIPNWAWAVNFDLLFVHQIPMDPAVAKLQDIENAGWVRCVR